MFGLIVLIVLVVYLSLLVWATRRGWRWAIEKKGWAGRKRYLGAAMGFLIVYLPVFWDWLPTVAVHQYYCATESGFWVYKTLEQWKKENPGAAEKLIANKVAPSRYESYNDGHGKRTTYLLNQRFNWVVIKQDISSLFPIMRFEQQVTDAKSDEVLARYIDFATGNSIKNTIGPPGPLRFWLHKGHCGGGELNDSKLAHFFIAAKNIKDYGVGK